MIAPDEAPAKVVMADGEVSSELYYIDDIRIDDLDRTPPRLPAPLGWVVLVVAWLFGKCILTLWRRSRR